MGVPCLFGRVVLSVVCRSILRRGHERVQGGLFIIPPPGYTRSLSGGLSGGVSVGQVIRSCVNTGRVIGDHEDVCRFGVVTTIFEGFGSDDYVSV